MERFYKEFNFTMDNMAWHYGKYSYPVRKIMHESSDLLDEIEKYYKFNLLSYHEYMQLRSKLQAMIHKVLFYK